MRQVPGAWGQGTGAHMPGGSRPGVRPEVNFSERTSVKAGRRSLKWKGGLLPLSLSRICGVPQAGHRGCLGTAPSAALGSLVTGPQPVCFQAFRALTCTGSTSSQRGCCSHVHGVLDGPAADILDGHRVSLRDGNTGCELGAPTGLGHRGRPVCAQSSLSPPGRKLSPSRHCSHGTSVFL